MEEVTLEGPFAVGTRVTMKPTGQDPITSVITEITENEHVERADAAFFRPATNSGWASFR